jgi:hypothetical protein
MKEFAATEWQPAFAALEIAKQAVETDPDSAAWAELLKTQRRLKRLLRLSRQSGGRVLNWGKGLLISPINENENAGHIPNYAMPVEQA